MNSAFKSDHLLVRSMVIVSGNTRPQVCDKFKLRVGAVLMAQIASIVADHPFVKCSHGLHYRKTK